jgi:hypothetical protein
MSDIHLSIKVALNYAKNTPGKRIIADWRWQTSHLCKPCWELKYCPYGPLVEQFPLLPILRPEALSHNEYLKESLKNGTMADGRKLDAARRRWFKDSVASFSPRNHPLQIPKVIAEASCKIFGHVCPVFFSAEPWTETMSLRAHSRRIPREVMIKVVRRDGQICQRCNTPVPDDEVEFDHVIPYSRGGTSTTENLRLVHRRCNRRKSASLDEVVEQFPFAQSKASRRKKKA